MSIRKIGIAWFSADQNVFQLVLGKKTSVGWLKSLDGLRAIAVLLVFLEHISGNVFRNDTPESGAFWGPFLNFGDAGMGRSGVYLFFVLSSFLLTSQLLKSKLNFKNPKFWLSYVLKRVLRIYPLYLFILLVYLIFPSFKFNIADVLQHLMLQEGLNHFWTIAVEVKYYLILPGIVWLTFLTLKRNLALSIGLFLVLIGVGEIGEAIDFSESRLAIAPHLPIFFIGSFAALAHAQILQLSEAVRQKIRSGMEITAILALLIILFSFQTVWTHAAWSWIFGGEIPHIPSNHWLYTLHGWLWAIFLVCHLHGQGFISKALSYSPLRFVGIVSFGIYLWHIAILGYLNAHLQMPSIVKFLAIFVVTLAVSTVTYLMIERPCMRLKFGFLAVKG